MAGGHEDEVIGVCRIDRCLDGLTRGYGTNRTQRPQAHLDRDSGDRFLAVGTGHRELATAHGTDGTDSRAGGNRAGDRVTPSTGQRPEVAQRHGSRRWPKPKSRVTNLLVVSDPGGQAPAAGLQ